MNLHPNFYFPKKLSHQNPIFAGKKVEKDSDYLKGLSPEQRAAVQQINGPVMLIAGAGSGKTRVITYRVAHLIRNGGDPFNILVLTFTNKAARAMAERITG